MRIGIRMLALSLLIFLAFGKTSEGEARQQALEAPPSRAPADIIRAEGYPPLGKWMMSGDSGYADWLGARFEGRRLREPINIILIDPFAGSAEKATRRLLAECAEAGFTVRLGHSGGYSAWLGDRFFPQIPSEKLHAISDEPFELRNNHGRFFGPFFWARKYFFSGALSREKLAPGTKAEHVYVSFNQARDRFAQAMSEKSAFKTKALLNLDNALLDDPVTGTGDHDGIAVVLTAVR